VLDDVAAGKLSGAREAELEDALDPLERLASPEAYPETTRLLIRLRVALGGRHEPVPPRAAPPLDLRLAVYLGVTDALDVLAARLQAAEVGLREAARSGLARLSEKEVDDARAAAADHVDEEALCAVPLGSSPLRALVPPPERALVCAPLRLLAAADRSPGTPVASLVAHDDVAVALWAARVATGATDVDAVRASCPLLSAVPSARQDRLVRAAFVQPVRVLAAGLAVALVEADGVEASPARARAWMSYGDAPFDVVAPQLPAK
jgi:hypothetical protein